MTTAHDIVAETNPAYCAVALANFTKAYCKASSRHAPLVLAYIALPLALSDELADTFDGCNIRTGLLVWLDRNPRIKLKLASRINPSLDICTSAIRFGCLYGVLSLDDSGHLIATSEKLPSVASTSVTAQAFKRARLLGVWFAGVGSARTVCESLGVTV